MSLPSFTSFARYACVGVLNTAVHWGVFFALVYEAEVPQSLANFIAFLGAVSVSYGVNAGWTFKAPRSRQGYFLYLGFMGLLALGSGWLGQWLAAPPLLTAVVFSAVSLVVGYAYARRVVFKSETTPC